MPHFSLKFMPRPTFFQDMTPAESEVIKQHSAYLDQHKPGGKILFMGMVLDPQAPHGLIILEVNSPEEVRAFAENDPSVKAGVNKFEFQPFQPTFQRK